MKTFSVVPKKDTPSVKLIAINWAAIPWYKRGYKWLTIRRKWTVTEDFVVWSEKHQANIVVPKGFVFDFASVPKMFSGFFSPTGLLAEGSVPHDFGYRYGGFLVVQTDGSLRFRPSSRQFVDDTMYAVGVYCTGAKFQYGTARRLLKYCGGPSFQANPFKFEDYSGLLHG